MYCEAHNSPAPARIAASVNVTHPPAVVYTFGACQCTAGPLAAVQQHSADAVPGPKYHLTHAANVCVQAFIARIYPATVIKDDVCMLAVGVNMVTGHACCFRLSAACLPNCTRVWVDWQMAHACLNFACIKADTKGFIGSCCVLGGTHAAYLAQEVLAR